MSMMGKGIQRSLAIMKKWRISGRIVPAIMEFESETNETVGLLPRKDRADWDAWSERLLDQIDLAIESEAKHLGAQGPWM